MTANEGLVMATFKRMQAATPTPEAAAMLTLAVVLKELAQTRHAVKIDDPKSGTGGGGYPPPQTF